MKAQQWQPIKTAPKDGTKVDLWLHIYASPRSFGMSDSFRVTDAHWNGESWVHPNPVKDESLYTPYVKKWMPIPKEPA